MHLTLIICAITVAAVSGLPGLGLARTSAWGERIAAAGMACAALAGLAGAVGELLAGGGGAVASRFFPWPAAGNGFVGLDALSAFFLVPIFSLGGLGSVFGLGYWPQRHHPGNGRKLRLFWGLLVAGMALLVISRHALTFLLGWEFMALSAFFLVSTEDHLEESREAGWVYLVSTHVGTLALFALFALWRHATGSYLLQPPATTLSLGWSNLLFFVALLAFGLKAGAMPVHFWLPGAHANAPSHVSALMSGVVIKMGIYGLVRWLSLLPSPPGAWGGLLLALGMVSAVLGVVFAIGQHDLKRLLAYHSVENIGIIVMGLGVAMLGRAAHRPEWVALGMAGCLLHVWNHSLFKALLFLCAGSVVHGAHTRQLDRMGGLARSMPWTAALFLTGAVAICGLPPLNGFVSEWFVYRGMFDNALATGNGSAAAMLGVPALAMVGALAVACFVKVFGTAFLGEPRTGAAAQAREAPFSMRLPMVVLAACCALIGLAPALVVPSLNAAIGCWSPSGNPSALDLAQVAPPGILSVLAIALLVGAGGVALVVRRRGAATPLAPTWDCGYARPNARMQYTASSFAQSLVRLSAPVLRPRASQARAVGLCPPPIAFHSHVDEVVLDRVLLPTGRRIEGWFTWFRRFQQGSAQHYLLYILLTLLAMLCTLFPFKAILTHWFAR